MSRTGGVEETRLNTKRRVTQAFEAKLMASRRRERFVTGELLTQIDSPESPAQSVFIRINGLRPSRGLECRYIIEAGELNEKTAARLSFDCAPRPPARPALPRRYGPRPFHGRAQTSLAVPGKVLLAWRRYRAASRTSKSIRFPSAANAASILSSRVWLSKSKSRSTVVLGIFSRRASSAFRMPEAGNAT